MAKIKAKILMDPERPKVAPTDVKDVLERYSFEVTSRSPDIGVVVGGDGVFGFYGRTESIPLLFVGVRSEQATGSKAFLAEAYYDELPVALEKIRNGEYGVVEQRRLEVSRDGKKMGDVFTDVYLERGSESNSLRYGLQVKGKGISFTESAIGDGVVVCTAAGSTGYFSYPDKISLGDWLEPSRFTTLTENEVGVCHIVPTFTKRENEREHPLRYILPWETEVEIRLHRPADARLYGVVEDRGGLKIEAKDVIKIGPSANMTSVIKV
ncbi:MAG: hypothetical protein OK422_02075 [Thaumarchaeota archaeon]|nr:hypothetical protein [Nitrososphaerota archaeon]